MPRRNYMCDKCSDYTWKTITKPCAPTECYEDSHKFVDVFDYKEDTIYGESITITKKYILSYCKVCGYTINGRNTCTE